jgi:uncharacterized membrane protein SirB2
MFNFNTEKIFNGVLKVFGTLFIINAILCMFNLYMPNKFSIICIYFTIGFIFLSAKYSKKEI